MARPDIGRVDCPACGKDAALRESTKGKAYVMCDECGFQGFARGVDSDKALRSRIKSASASVPVSHVAAEPAADPGPALPSPSRQPQKTPQVTRRVHSSEGTTETTIFDALGAFLKS